MKKVYWLAFLFCLPQQTQAADWLKRVWKVTAVIQFSAGMADYWTTRGKLEANPLLASGNNRFGAKGVAIKVGGVAAFSAVQILIHRHYRNQPQIQRAWDKGFIGGNVGLGALLGRQAYLNSQIPRN